MDLIKIYESILRFSGLEADEQGYISTALDDKSEPAFINGLRMVLPTSYHLRNYNPKEKIIFHPFTENILRGESEVIQKLKLALNIRLNYTTGVVAQYLLNLVASPALHAKLDPEQAEILGVVKDADEKSVLTLTNLMISGVKENPDRIFTNVFLKRGGFYKGKKYSRVGVVTFPFYENIVEGKVEKIRVKDRDTYRQLFEFIYPGIGTQDEYNFGSDSDVAPFLEALLRSVANLASRLNDIIKIYEPYIDEADSLYFDADWLEYFQDLNALIPEIRKIPVQFGNDGTISIIEENKVEHVADVPTSQPVVTYNAPVVAAPTKPEIKKTSRGLDFKSVMQNNAAVAMNANPLAPQLIQQQWQQQMQNQPAAPSWATPVQQPQAPWQGQPAPGFPGGPQVFMTPQGPFVQTPYGNFPVMMSPQGPYFQSPQGPILIPPQAMPPGTMPMQQIGMNPTPSWANNQGQPTMQWPNRY